MPVKKKAVDMFHEAHKKALEAYSPKKAVVKKPKKPEIETMLEITKTHFNNMVELTEVLQLMGRYIEEEYKDLNPVEEMTLPPMQPEVEIKNIQIVYLNNDRTMPYLYYSIYVSDKLLSDNTIAIPHMPIRKEFSKRTWLLR